MIVQIAEIRFDANLSFFNLREKIGTPLIDKLFSGWQIDAVTLNLYDNDKLISSVLETKRLTLTSIDEKCDFKDVFSKVANAYFKHIEVNKIKRFGYRKIEGLPLTYKFDEVVKLFEDRIYPSNKQFKGIFPNRFTDVSFVGDTTIDKFNIHFLSGPAKKQECFKRIDENSSFAIPIEKTDLKDVNLLLDTDVFLQDFDNKNLESLIERALKVSKQTQEEFTKFVLD